MSDQQHIIAIDARRLRSTTGRYTRELLNNLEKIDSHNTYHVIIHDKDVGHWQPKSKNFLLHVVPWDHYTFGEQIGFLKFLNGLKADLVHFTMPQQPWFYNRPKVTSVHDLTLVNFKNEAQNSFVYAVKQSIFKSLLKRAVKTSQKTLTLAEYTKAEIAEYANVSPEKIVVANAASGVTTTTQKTYKTAVGKDFIMYVGNTFPYKNISRLMQAHQLLLEKLPDLNLLIVGKIDKDVERLQKEVKQNDYKQVYFTGFVSDEELAWLYKNGKAYVFPSLSEGFGMPALEAMQFGMPVASSDATVLPEIYEEAAHYFNPEDTKDMARAIKEILVDKKLQTKLTAAGYKQVNKYSWQKMAQQTHDTYIQSLVVN